MWEAAGLQFLQLAERLVVMAELQDAAPGMAKGSTSCQPIQEAAGITEGGGIETGQTVMLAIEQRVDGALAIAGGTLGRPGVGAIQLYRLATAYQCQRQTGCGDAAADDAGDGLAVTGRIASVTGRLR